MPNKNSLANKKRKKIKSDGTSISGYLLSSFDNTEVSNSSDHSLDSTEFPSNLTSVANKKRLSTEFDDSFDLFRTKKKSNSATEISPIKNTESSPAKKSPPKNKSPRSKKVCKVVKKCDYFDKSPSLVVPCPFCFKFEEDIFTHISTNCNRPAGVSDEKITELIDIHTDYWNQRKSLGIPDVTLNEDEVFISTLPVHKSKSDTASESSSDIRVPLLKWNSKSKKSKYSLLRQNKAERENKITQKLAILLMDKESNHPTDLNTTFHKQCQSNYLSNFLSKESTFWNKCRLPPEQVTEDTYYVKALAPLIAPVSKKVPDPLPQSTSLPLQDPKMEEEDAEVAEIFSSPADSPVRTDSYFNPLQNNPSPKPEMKDSCFTETDVSECKNDTYQSQLSKNWEEMLNCSDLSDTIVAFSDGSLFSHSLVFYANSIKIFRAISSCSGKETDKILDWREIPSSAGIPFIKYIYTGQINHFNSLNSSDLETISLLCEYYEESNLKTYLDTLNPNSNEKPIKDNRNLSPDIFDDSEPNSPSNSTFTVNKFEDSNSSKRKLESPNFIDSSKKIKTESDGDVSKKCTQKCSTIVKDRDDVVSISSDGGSISSAMTMSPGRYEKLMNRPISRCSTLPPLSESPNNEENSVPFAENTNFPDPLKMKLDSPISFTKNIDENSSTVPFNSNSPDTNIKNVDSPFARNVDSHISQSVDFPFAQHIDSPFAKNVSSPLRTENNSPVHFTESPSPNFESKALNENFECNPNSKSPDLNDSNLFYDNDLFDYNDYELIASQNENDPNLQNEIPQPLESKDEISDSPVTNINKPSQVRNSLEKYFDDSIPDFFESPVSRCKTPLSRSSKDSPPIRGLYQSTPTQPISKDMMTPSPQILVSDKITPMVNYSTLISPELKGELQRYGLKPDMDKKKAKTLLRYIYDLIHPEIPSVEATDHVEGDDLVPENYSGIHNETPVRLNSSPTNERFSLEHDEGDANKVNTSTEFLLAYDSEENSGKLDFECSQNSPSSEEPTSYLNKNQLLDKVIDFIKNDAVLFESTLMYVPIWLTKFHQALKEKGIKCTSNDLMDVLDQLCITFRTEKRPRENKRNKKKPS